MPKIVIYTTKDGHIQLNVKLVEETVWLTQKQMADLFDKNVRTVSEHINNIFKEGELEENSVIRNFRITVPDGKVYDTKHYNLDVVISVGYRVRSKQGTAFRQWATNVLKDHLIKGYTIYKPRLAQQGLHELEQTVELLQKTLKHHELVSDLGSEAIQLILSYAKTWSLLLAYDEGKLELPKKGKQAIFQLNYEAVVKSIDSLKSDLKDHPFTDGNKLIGCFVFLLYLKAQNAPVKLNENGLVALALLIAESNLSQKEIMIRLIVNILVD